MGTWGRYANARASNRFWRAGRLDGDASLDRGVATFTHAYTGQNEANHDSFTDAPADGKLQR